MRRQMQENTAGAAGTPTFLTIWKLSSAFIQIALAVVLVLFLVTLVFQRFTSWDLRAVLTGSMEPTFKVGGVVLSRPVDPRSINVGDVIVFRASTARGAEDAPLITHRVVSIREEAGQPVFKTRGDNNDTEDSFDVFARDVTGKVVVHVPYLGYLLAIFQKPLGFLLAVCIPVGWFIVSQVRRLVAEVNRARRESQL